MAESTLSLGLPDFEAAVGHLIGYGATTGNWTAAQDAHVQRIIKRGLRQFYYHARMPDVAYNHEWSFLKPVVQLTLNAPYSTGTIEYDHTGGASERLVTLTSGTWPSWAAYGKLNIANVLYDVSTREGDTTLTLTSSSNPGADVASGTSYELTQDDYTLPDDCAGVLGDMTFEPNVATHRVVQRGENQIRRLRQGGIITGTPSFFAVRVLASDQTTGQRMEAIFHPTPNDSYILTYRYNALPQALTDGAPYPLGGAMHAETILAAILSVAELDCFDEQREQTSNYRTLLEQAIQKDQGQFTSRNVGQNRDPSDGGTPVNVAVRRALYNGTLYTG
jgi:hypothetical protein